MRGPAKFARGMEADLGQEPIAPGVKRMLVLALAGAVLMPWLVYRSLNRTNIAESPVTPAAARAAVGSANAVTDVANAAKNTATLAVGTPSKLRLSDGTELNAAPEGMEVHLLNYLHQPSPTASVSQPDSTWFDFDRITFQSGTADLQVPSQEQLQNVAKILRVYPNVNVEIAAFGDNASDKAADQRLSATRAKHIKDELTTLGVDPSRITSKGFGDQRPPAENDSMDKVKGGGQAQASLIVTRK